MKSWHYIRPQLSAAALLLLGVLPGQVAVGAIQSSDLDSLRSLIYSLQDEIEKRQANLENLSERFNEINLQVYEYKADQNKGVSPIARLRGQNALKASHHLADSLDSVNKSLRAKKSALQRACVTAIHEIDLQIQHELIWIKGNPKDKRQRKARLTLIKDMENEKANYAARVQTTQVDEKGWEKITIEPEDTLRRLNLKTTLLEDFLTNLRQSLRALGRELATNAGDMKTYTELRDFYKELDESLDDDQDIFDRDRIEELQDKLDNLDSENRTLGKKQIVLNTDMAILIAKIDRFKVAIAEKEGF